MYNFSIRSSLKAWIDQIVRLGKTLGDGPSGPQGLLENKEVVVITARGGAYEKGTPRETFDFQEPYLRHILGFLGITDVTFIHAENQLRRPVRRSQPWQNGSAGSSLSTTSKSSLLEVRKIR